ncbi:small multi-drug export protein [Salipaludibacillus keqinensis]|nr:small multi-drug export protein [Salipaludibacillus keqinensis]
MFDLIWQYLLIFFMAATPWLEILIVIPIGIGMGLNPFWVGIISFVGNFLPIIIIVYSLTWFQKTNIYKKWKQKRSLRKSLKNSEKPIQTSTDSEVEPSLSAHNYKQNKAPKKTKKDRAADIFHKYGLPGLALLGPAITGIHLAALIALSLKADKHTTTWWMAGSLAAWTVFLTIASYYSLDWIVNIFS